MKLFSNCNKVTNLKGRDIRIKAQKLYKNHFFGYSVMKSLNTKRFNMINEFEKLKKKKADKRNEYLSMAFYTEAIFERLKARTYRGFPIRLWRD